MRFHWALLGALCGGLVCAQTPEVAEVARAKAGMEKLRELVEAGAAPRAQLDKAEDVLADAEDVALLRKTLYGSDLTDEQAEAMLAAAGRRVERRKRDLEQGRQLVKEGVASLLSLGTFLEEVDRAKKEYDLAESRARLVRELAQMARLEDHLQQQLDQAPSDAHEIAERFDGNGLFSERLFRRIEQAYEIQFAKPLPVSAKGETAVHRALGFDHRGRVDVAIQPDQREGVWLRQYLEENDIPYFAFRKAVPGKATGAHIHIGPISTRIVRGG